MNATTAPTAARTGAYASFFNEKKPTAIAVFNAIK